MSTVTNIASKQVNIPKLDDVKNDFETWRKTKTHRSEQIPDELWFKVFELENQYKPKQIRDILMINKKQYDTKHEQLCSGQSESKQPIFTNKPLYEAKDASNKTAQGQVSAIDSLCEVNVKKEPYKLAPLPSAKTMIVEFCRSDGKVMKIHTTQDSISTLMKAFFEGE